MSQNEREKSEDEFERKTKNQPELAARSGAREDDSGQDG
jgi:hypothetical protein